jgi:hypothetical protein
VTLVQVGAQLLDSLLDHLFNLVEQLGAKVAERLAHDLADVGPLRRQRDRDNRGPDRRALLFSVFPAVSL